MTVKLEGNSKEYELPEIEDQDDMIDLDKRNENNAEFQKKVFEIQKELNL